MDWSVFASGHASMEYGRGDFSWLQPYRVQERRVASTVVLTIARAEGVCLPCLPLVMQGRIAVVLAGPGTATASLCMCRTLRPRGACGKCDTAHMPGHMNALLVA